MKTCYIVGAGDVFDAKIKAEEDDFIICADGGYKYKNIFGRECDLVVGDFDSLGRVPEVKEKIVAPTEKDETDMMLAVMSGYDRGYRNFVILGALGGERYDHSLANIQLLSFIASKGARGTLIHNDNIFVAFKNGEITLEDKLKGYISVFSLCDESRGVTIENLKYNLNDATLRSDMPIGVSNEFLGKKSRIEVKNGTLLVCYKR